MKAFKTLIAALVMTLMTLGAQAQELKFAHIDSQKFIQELPEAIKAQADLQAEAAKLEDQIKVMNNELQQKYADYIQKRDSLPELIRVTKEKEIQDTQTRIQEFQQVAQMSLQQKEQQLLGPVLESYQKALQAVGKENGFIYIFDTTSQVILYHSEQSVDAAPLVKAKMSAK